MQEVTGWEIHNGNGIIQVTPVYENVGDFYD